MVWQLLKANPNWHLTWFYTVFWHCIHFDMDCMLWNDPQTIFNQMYMRFITTLHKYKALTQAKVFYASSHTRIQFIFPLHCVCVWILLLLIGKYFIIGKRFDALSVKCECVCPFVFKRRQIFALSSIIIVITWQQRKKNCRFGLKNEMYTTENVNHKNRLEKQNFIGPMCHRVRAF